MKHVSRSALAFLVVALLGAAIAEGASIAPVVSILHDKQQMITWSGMAGADTPTSARVAGCTDMHLQVSGTFGTTSVGLSGSMDDAVYQALDDAIGTPAALACVANCLKRVQQRSLFIKPSLSGGTGTALKVVVLCFTNYP